MNQLKFLATKLKHGQLYAISIGAIFISDQPQKIPYDGPDLDSTGQQVNKWTARECETRRVGGTRPQKQKK